MDNAIGTVILRNKLVILGSNVTALYSTIPTACGFANGGILFLRQTKTASTTKKRDVP